MKQRTGQSYLPLVYTSTFPISLLDSFLSFRTVECRAWCQSAWSSLRLYFAIRAFVYWHWFVECFEFSGSIQNLFTIVRNWLHLRTPLGINKNRNDRIQNKTSGQCAGTSQISQLRLSQFCNFVHSIIYYTKILLEKHQINQWCCLRN